MIPYGVFIRSTAFSFCAMTDSSTTTPDPKRIIPIQPDPGAAQARREEVVSLYKKSDKIYAREVEGWFANWRYVLIWVTQLAFYGTPWLMWNDRQAVLFDLSVRRFYMFNLVLYPQDFIYLTALLVISAYGLFLFTTVAGRLWCGYACPQTVYTEMFMWIENKIAAGSFNAAVKELKAITPADAVKAFGHGVVVSRSKSGALSIKGEKK